MNRAALRLSLRLGALYDVLLAVFVWFGARPVLHALGHPDPDPPVYLFLTALPLVLFPALYLVAARTPEIDPFRIPVLWARFGGGGTVLALTAVAPPPGAIILVTAGVCDLAWGMAHLVLWRR